MRAAIRFMCFTLALLVLSVATVACAATFTFSNGLDLRMSVTLTYFDRDLDALTTRGWWHVEPGGETVITVNADELRGVYYAAFNRVPFIDSSTRGNPQIVRWASPRTFAYTTDEEPFDYGAWQAHFYRIDGQIVHIDARR